MVVGTFIVAPAQMEPNLLLRNAIQGVVEGFDPLSQRRPKLTQWKPNWECLPMAASGASICKTNPDLR